MKRFWEFKNAVGDPSSAELLIYGEIAESTWWGDEVTPRQFASDLAQLGNITNLTVRINSNGGDVFAAHTIYNMLLQHQANIIVRIDGIAASAATIIMLAGNEIIMPANAMLMIHNPWSISIGESADMRKMADLLDKVRDTILAVYETRTGQSKDELIALMDAVTWMSADEAVAAGFADKVETNKKIVSSYASGRLNINGLSMDISKMKMVPVALLMSATTDTVSPPIEGDGDNTAPAVAEQTNQEDVSMSEASKVDQPGDEPVVTPAAEPTETSAEIASRERTRVLAIQELATPGAEEIIKAAIANGDSPAETALAIMRSGAVKSANALADRKVDAKAAVVDGVPVEGQAAAEKEGRIAKMVAAGNSQLRFLRGGGVK